MLLFRHCSRSFGDRLFMVSALILEQNWSTASRGTKYCQRSAPVIVTHSARLNAVQRSWAQLPVVEHRSRQGRLLGRVCRAGFAVGGQCVGMERSAALGPGRLPVRAVAVGGRLSGWLSHRSKRHLARSHGLASGCRRRGSRGRACRCPERWGFPLFRALVPTSPHGDRR